MKRQSYKIKHDFLFDVEDAEVVIPHLDSILSDKSELKLSDVFIAKDENAFNKLINGQKANVVIVDDIGECKNPASERYKQFIIRCVCCKLKNKNINVYYWMNDNAQSL